MRSVPGALATGSRKRLKRRPMIHAEGVKWNSPGQSAKRDALGSQPEWIPRPEGAKWDHDRRTFYFAPLALYVSVGSLNLGRWPRLLHCAPSARRRFGRARHRLICEWGLSAFIQSRNQSLNLLVTIKEVRCDSNALRFLSHNHSATQ